MPSLVSVMEHEEIDDLLHTVGLHEFICHSAVSETSVPSSRGLWLEPMLDRAL